MARQRGTLITRLLHRAVLARWSRVAAKADSTDLPSLRKQRNQARALRQRLDRLIHVADGRLALPMIGSNAVVKPHGTDWAWRPDLWKGPLPVRGMSSVATGTMIGDQATLFHDCPREELTLRQLRNTRERDLAPFGLRMDVFRFDGSFLSLVIDLPPDAAIGLMKRHLVRLETIVEMEKPLEIFARLNIKHGPNTEQIVRELPLGEENPMVEFDLAYTRMNEKRVERIWLDLIFEGPQMNQVILRDLTLSRRPRAEL